MVVSVLFTLCLLADDLQYRENVAENPSVEEDRDRDTFPDGWRPYAFDSPARLDWDDSVSHSGKRSLRISDSFRAGRSTKELAEEGYRALVRTWKNLQRLFENDNGNRGSGSWNVTATNGLP